jgi:cytochrome c2
MKKQTIRWNVWVAAAVLIGAAAGVVAARAEGPAGQEVFEAQKCDLCHSVSTAGIEAKTKSEAMRGPDLVDLDVDADWIASYITKKVDKDGKAHKKEFKGTDEELKTLIDWLLEQKS